MVIGARQLSHISARFCTTGNRPARTARHCLGVLLAGGISACAVGPDFKRPDLSPEAKYTRNDPGATVASDTTGGIAQTFTNQVDVPGQ